LQDGIDEMASDFAGGAGDQDVHLGAYSKRSAKVANLVILRKGNRIGRS
jgi:hypothetical protein